MKLAAVVVALAGVAYADTPVTRPEAIEVDRDVTPPGRVEFGFDGGAPVGVWALGAEVGYLDQPLELHTVELKTFPVEHRETLVLGGAVVVGDSVVLDVRMPLSHQVGPRLSGFGDDQPLEHFVPGDLAIGARLHVASRGPISAFVRGVLTLPTGEDFEFAGEARYTLSTSLIARASLPAGIVIAATTGIHVRAAEVQIEDRTAGDELTGGLGATIAVPPIARLWCTPDQLKLAVEVVGVLGDNIAGKRGPSPIEARLGVIGQPRPDLTIGVRIGAGLDDQIGAPRFRVTLELAWHAPPPTPRAAAPESEPELED